MKSQIQNKRPIQEIKWHPFVIKKAFELCQKFSFEELKKIYRKIVQIDFDIKTGKIDAESSLDFFIAQI